jgi:hypothetical protein
VSYQGLHWRDTNEGREENNNNNNTKKKNTMDDDEDYQDDEEIESDDVVSVAHAVVIPDRMNVVETSERFMTDIMETIRDNQVTPLKEEIFHVWKEKIENVFFQVKTWFGNNEYKGMVQKFTKLLSVREYRESMDVLPDLMLLMVDTMEEAGIEVFPNVSGGTRILQGMFRKYGCYLRVQVFPWFSQYFPIQSISSSGNMKTMST